MKFLITLGAVLVIFGAYRPALSSDDFENSFQMGSSDPATEPASGSSIGSLGATNGLGVLGQSTVNTSSLGFSLPSGYPSIGTVGNEFPMSSPGGLYPAPAVGQSSVY